MRAARALAVLLVLLFGTIATEHRLRALPRPDPLGKELLYLPTPEVLRLLGMGNDGLMADALYVWAIQYYSRFDKRERFLYLEKVFDVITDLDPLYFDAYRLGALIMQVEAPGDLAEKKRAVTRLFDKGIAAMPDSWQLAETAAWDCYLGFRDTGLAVRYAEIAVRNPRAHHRVRRALGVWKDREDRWDIEDSIAYWQEALAEATTPGEELLTKSHLYDVIVARDREVLNPLLRSYRARFGTCPQRWEDLIVTGQLFAPPLDYAGNPYEIDPAACAIVANKKIRS
jgi:hypothetical protein